MPDNSTFNYLSSRGRAIIGGQIPQDTLSLVIEYQNSPLSGNLPKKVDFQMPPQSLTESKSAHYASDQILGRFEPVRMYSNSEATRINFDVSYYWLEDNFKYSINAWEGIKSNISVLRGLLHPYSEGRLSSQDVPADVKRSVDPEYIAQFVGKMTPPPICRLFFGDIYRGMPCILTSLNITYNGPWNDAGLAAVARRLAAQAQSRFSDALKHNADINLGSQSIDPVSRIVDLIPGNWGVKGYLTNALQTLVQSDQLFPLETKISIGLESVYKFGTQLTYGDIVYMPGLNENITNLGNPSTTPSQNIGG